MKLNVKQTVIISLTFLTVMMLWQVYNWYVPLFLNDYLNNLFSGDKIVIGVIMALDNLFATFMIPIMSALSDRCNSKIGKRMPFIIVGILVSALSFVLLPFINEFGSIWLLITDILVILIAMNTYRSPCVSLIPDVTPKELRAEANGINNIVGGIGVAIGYLIVLFTSKINNRIPFVITSIIMIICLSIVLLTINEPKLVALNPSYNKKQEENIDKNKKGNRKTVLLSLLVVFFVFMANNAVETWISLYTEEVFKDVTLFIPINPGMLIMVFFGLGTFAFSIPSAKLSAKIGRKTTVLIGSILMSICYGGVSIIQYINNFSYFVLVFALIGGAGLSFIVVNIYPMIVENCTYNNLGKYTGFYYTSSMLAQSITPPLSGLFLSKIVFGNMKVLFPYCMIFMLLSIFVIIFIKEE